MKTKLSTLFAFVLISCSTDELPIQSKIANNNTKPIHMFTVCGTVFTAQTLFTSGTPSTFVGVRYDILLDTPYLGNTKAYFILNNVNNTPFVQQYWTNPATYYCGDSAGMVFYN